MNESKKETGDTGPLPPGWTYKPYQYSSGVSLCQQAGQWHEYTTVVQSHYQVPGSSDGPLDRTDVWVICVKCGSIVKPAELLPPPMAVSEDHPSVESQWCVLSGTRQWSDFLNSDPVRDINAQGLSPKRIFISDDVIQELRGHPRMIDRHIKSGRRTLDRITGVGS